jgi:hypothetical protein
MNSSTIINSVMYLYLYHIYSFTMTPTLKHKDCCYIALARYLRKRKRNSGSSSHFTYFNFQTVARLVCLKGFPNVTSTIITWGKKGRNKRWCPTPQGPSLRWQLKIGQYFFHLQRTSETNEKEHDGCSRKENELCQKEIKL